MKKNSEKLFGEEFFFTIFAVSLMITLLLINNTKISKYNRYGKNPKTHYSLGTYKICLTIMLLI